MWKIDIILYSHNLRYIPSIICTMDIIVVQLNVCTTKCTCIMQA